MENVSSIVMLVCLCSILIAFIGYILFKAIKNRWISKLLDTIKTSIKEAEDKYPSGHGEEKKQYVLAQIEAKCKELNIPVNMIFSAISKLINTIIENYNIIKKGK